MLFMYTMAIFVVFVVVNFFFFVVVVIVVKIIERIKHLLNSANTNK
jgi:predicted PurR-regulated permease PerM